MKTCYYVVLGLKKPSNDDEVRKAYKKMALKWHPDKNPDNIKEAEEKFKEVGEAYAVLSDQRKKDIYDTYGHEGLTPGGRGGGFSGSDFGGFSGGFTFGRAEDMFREMFGRGFFDDDDFGPSFMKSRGNGSNQRKGGHRDPFDAFGFGGFGGFGGGFGKGFGDDNDFFGGSMLSGGFGGGVGKSTSTSTFIRDGKKVTVKKVTTVDADGTRHTEVTESVTEGDRTTTKKYLDGAKASKKESKSVKQ